MMIPEFANVAFATVLLCLNTMVIATLIAVFAGVIAFIVFAVCKFVYNLLGFCSNPDIKRTDLQIIEHRGFEAEQHKVRTEDGYILTVHRVVNPLIKKLGLELKPVILMHGMGGSSAGWILTGNQL